jgi:hypothetical protein
MAFYTRKKGIDLWKNAIFDRVGFCLCCKGVCQPGESGLISKKRKKADKSFLCDNCVIQWRDEYGYNVGLCEMPRFSMEQAGKIYL